MGLQKDDVSLIVEFLSSVTTITDQNGIVTPLGMFSLNEFSTVGKFWETLKQHIKKEKYDFDFAAYDVFSRILNVCLTRKGDDPSVLRMILALFDKTQILRDSVKSDASDKDKETAKNVELKHKEDIVPFVTYLHNKNQPGMFVLDEFVIVGKLWEDLQEKLNKEATDLTADQLAVVTKILNVCLNRKGNNPAVLRKILDLLDRVEVMQDSLAKEKKSETTKPSKSEKSSITEIVDETE